MLIVICYLPRRRWKNDLGGEAGGISLSSSGLGPGTFIGAVGSSVLEEDPITDNEFGALVWAGEEGGLEGLGAVGTLFGEAVSLLLPC